MVIQEVFVLSMLMNDLSVLTLNMSTAFRPSNCQTCCCYWGMLGTTMGLGLSLRAGMLKAWPVSNSGWLMWPLRGWGQAGHKKQGGSEGGKTFHLLCHINIKTNMTWAHNMLKIGSATNKRPRNVVVGGVSCLHMEWAWDCQCDGAVRQRMCLK